MFSNLLVMENNDKIISRKKTFYRSYFAHPHKINPVDTDVPTFHNFQDQGQAIVLYLASYSTRNKQLKPTMKSYTFNNRFL